MNPVVIYTTRYCPYCVRAKHLLTHKGVAFKEIAVDGRRALGVVTNSGNIACDILVNCAGIAHIGKADTTTEADFEKIFQVNVKGTYNCLHEAIPIFKQQGAGIILNVASVAAWVGIDDRFAYSMSKGAVYAMTLSVAKDYL